MAHVCRDCTKPFHPLCPVCDALYSGINAMREEVYWERIDWDMRLAPAELEYEFDRLASIGNPSREPRLVVVLDLPASDTFDEDFAAYLDTDAMDVTPASEELFQVASIGFDTQSSQYPLHRQYWHILQAPTKDVAFPVPSNKGDVYVIHRVRMVPPVTGYGRMSIAEGEEAGVFFEQRMSILSRGVDNIEFADYHAHNQQPSVHPSATIPTEFERVAYPQHQSTQAAEQVAPASSILGSSAQANNTTISASQRHVRFAADDGYGADQQSDDEHDAKDGLATRSNARLQVTAAHKSATDHHNYIAAFRCMYCDWDSGRIRRSDAPRRHRIGNGFAKCPVAQVVGVTSGERNANFLLARWPQLLEMGFADDQLKGKLQTMCQDFAAKVEAGTAQWTTLVQARLAAFEAHRTVPGPNTNFLDREMLAIPV